MILYSTGNWEVIFVTGSQAFVGECIISNKNNRKSLSELDMSEWIELGEIEKTLETVCKNAFDATMYNFACLMNNAYNDGTTPNVHFHFIPRYNHELNLFDKRYVDKHFGHNFWKWANSKFNAQKNIYSDAQILVIYEKMYNELEKIGLVESKIKKNDNESGVNY